MNCLHARELFSARYENALPPERERELRQHLVRCARCHRSWAGFARSIVRLRASGVAPVPEAHVAAILAATEELAGAPLRERWARERLVPAPRRALASVLGHALAAALGAAAALLLWSRPVAGTPADPAPLDLARAPLALVLDEHAARSFGAERSRGLAPGERLSAGALGGLALARDAQGVLWIEAEEAAPPVVAQRTVYTALRIEPARSERAPEEPRAEPTATRAERPVERVIRRGPLLALELDADGLVRAAQVLGAALERTALVARAERPATPAALDESPTFAPLGAARELELVAAREEPREGRSPVTIRRVDGRVTLETRGAPDEVVPALIARLDAGDAEVAALALQQLEAIRSGLSDSEAVPPLASAAGPRPEHPFRPEDPFEAMSRVFSGHGPRGTGEHAPVADPVTWSTWWEGRADSRPTPATRTF